jgi:hypothetical protein
VTGLLTTVNINNKKIVFNELKLKDYKTILKCLVSEPIDPDNLFLNINQILKKITNLSIKDIEDLNLLEYLLLLVHIRVIGIGSSIFGVYKNEEASINVEISLHNTIQQIESCLTNFQFKIFEQDLIKITTTIPSIKQFLSFKSYPQFKEEVNNLPLKYLKNIQQLISDYDQYFANYYFFKSPIDKYSIKINLQKDSYCQLIKILFNENLITVYDNIYYLCKFSQLTPNYLENCTYGEFKIYIKKTEELLYKSSKPQPPPVQEEETFYDPVDINSLYGNEDTTPVISRSEFTP